MPIPFPSIMFPNVLAAPLISTLIPTLALSITVLLFTLALEPPEMSMPVTVVTGGECMSFLYVLKQAGDPQKL